MKFIAEVTRQPVEIEPPDGIGEEFWNGIRPGLRDAKQLDPRGGWTRLFWKLLVDVSKFGGGERRMFGGFMVLEIPHQYPRCREKAGDQKGGVPAKKVSRQGHQQRSQDHADIGAAVEDAERERALFLREPLSICFVGGGEVAGFADSKEGACDPELQYRVTSAWLIAERLQMAMMTM